MVIDMNRLYILCVLCAILVVFFVNPLIMRSAGSQRTGRESHKEHKGSPLAILFLQKAILFHLADEHISNFIDGFIYFGWIHRFRNPCPEHFIRVY